MKKLGNTAPDSLSTREKGLQPESEQNLGDGE